MGERSFFGRQKQLEKPTQAQRKTHDSNFMAMFTCTARDLML